MSASVRGAVLVGSLVVAIIGVMVALDSRRGAPSGVGEKSAPSSAAAGSVDAGAEVWRGDAEEAATEDGVGPQPMGPNEAKDPNEASVAERFDPAGLPEGSEPESDPDGPVVEFASSLQGPLYVTGVGVDGLTPLRTPPLGAGPHRLRLVGGRGAPPVVVVLSSQPPRLDATVSGDGGEALHVTCRGGISGPEPVTTAVGARLVCWIRSSTGTLTVELRVVGR